MQGAGGAETDFRHWIDDPIGARMTTMTIDLDIIELLERDHQRLCDLAERLDTVTDPAEIRTLFRQLVDGLLAHETIEHEILFPACRALLGAGAGPVDDRVGEHEELNDLLAEMLDLDSDDFAFVKRGSALVLEIERHFEYEAESVFEPMRAQVPRDDLIELARLALTPRDPS